MKGTIVDFDEVEKSGLILAEDGNRYPFDLSKWKSKNKSPEVDVEVDFVVDENQVSDIYSLSKNIPEVKATNEKVENTIENQSYSDIKKINFEEMENEVDKKLVDITEFKEKKKELRGILLTAISLFIGAITLIMYIDKNNPIGMLLALVIFVSSVAILVISVQLLIPKKLFDKIHRNDKILLEYEKHLKIINYTPNNLNFENVKIINARASTLEGAEKILLQEAYDLKADAIINYSNQFNTISSVNTSGFGSSKSVSTSVTAVNSISGLAIKVKE